jgi:hypothetical protein
LAAAEGVFFVYFANSEGNGDENDESESPFYIGGLSPQSANNSATSSSSEVRFE